MTEIDLENRIYKISDEEALEVVDYVGNWMSEKARMGGMLATIEAIPDDRSSIEILRNFLPELDGSLKEIYDSYQNAKIARNTLLFMAEQNSYATKVEEAIDRPALRGEPITVGLGTVILLGSLLHCWGMIYSDTRRGIPKLS